MANSLIFNARWSEAAVPFDERGTIISRADAKAAGSPTYWDGVPCTRGHHSYRRVSTGWCLQCELTLKSEKREDEAVEKVMRKHTSGLLNNDYSRPVHITAIVAAIAYCDEMAFRIEGRLASAEQVSKEFEEGANQFTMKDHYEHMCLWATRARHAEVRVGELFRELEQWQKEASAKRSALEGYIYEVVETMDCAEHSEDYRKGYEACLRNHLQEQTRVFEDDHSGTRMKGA